MMSKNSKERYHDKGEQDRADGKDYDRPHGLAEDLMTWSKSGMEKMYGDNDAYKKGWDNADKQDKK